MQTMNARPHRYSALAWVLLVIMVLLAGCEDDSSAPSAPSGPGGVEGNVTRFGSGDAVTDATLLLMDAATLVPVGLPMVTDSEGGYRFDLVEPGTYLVFLFHNSLITFDRTNALVEVGAGRTRVHNMRLIPSELWDSEGDRLEGTVTDVLTGEPLSCAFVGSSSWYSGGAFAMFGGISHPFWGVTDDQGFFSVVSDHDLDEHGQPSVPLTLLGVKEGYHPITKIIYPRPGKTDSGTEATAERDTTLTVDLALIPLGSLDPAVLGSVTGQLVHLDAPVAGVEVAVVLVEGRNPPSADKVIIPNRVATTDDQGRFSLSGLGRGYYQLVPGYRVGDGWSAVSMVTGVDIFLVSSDDTNDLGVVEILREIRPIAPAVGQVLSSSPGELSWEAVPGASSYEVQWAFDGHLMDILADNLVEPRFEIPAEVGVPHGSCVRWFVRANWEDPETQQSWWLAETEMMMTFCVSEEE